MTNEEAKEILYGMTVRNFEQFQAINTAVAAIEKQIPKKVKNIEEKNYVSIGICPNCQVKVVDMISHDYCEECGQAIDWSEENDK